MWLHWMIGMMRTHFRSFAFGGERDRCLDGRLGLIFRRVGVSLLIICRGRDIGHINSVTGGMLG